jgi:catechol 2,3-dioxygenase-like lactoylglutathione lyase family enzyme
MSFDPNLVLLYVSSVEKSTSFYTQILNNLPVHSEPDYTMFLLKSGLRLGLWLQRAAAPEPTAFGGGTEIAIELEEDRHIDEYFAQYQNARLTIIQPPTQMDFGYTFVICDPDGHRIRLFAKNKQFKPN